MEYERERGREGERQEEGKKRGEKVEGRKGREGGREIKNMDQAYWLSD